MPMKVDGSLKSLLQGVSQQPPRDRLPGQCELQVNWSSDPVTGLTRRPPTDLVGSLVTSTSIRGWHSFRTVDGRKFITSFHDNTVSVHDLNGNVQPLTIASGASYITLAGELRCCTIDNNTYVVNRAAIPAMLTTTPVYSNSVKTQAVVQILGGAYGRAYSISIDNVVVATYQTPDGSAAAMIEDVRTAKIATVLEWLLANPMPGTALPAGFSTASGVKYTSTGTIKPVNGWSVVRSQDVLLIEKTVGAFTVACSDDSGNKNIKSMTTQVAGIEDLPRLAPHLFVVRVAEKTDPEQDLWFKFVVEGQEANLVPSNALFGTAGYWQETVATGVTIKLDPSKMPHMLTYEPTTGMFTFSQETWADRKVGTDKSNPLPSFVGLAIQDMCSFQGRLTLLAGPNVIMSRSNRVNDFWFGTVSAQADTDPVDVKSKVASSIMLAVVQHNRNLVVFSDKGQFVIYGKSTLTPANAALALTSSFEADLGARPVAAGRNVFFATNYGTYTGMREFFTDGGTDINDSRPITQHVNRFIVGDVKHITASSNYDTLVVQTDADTGSMYVYQYIWNDTEKVQSSWSVWQFSSEIVYTFFDEELLYFVKKVGDVYVLLRQPLDVQASVGVLYPIFLDERFDVFGAYTAFVLPYDYLHAADLVVLQGTNCPHPGLVATIQSIVWSVPLNGYVVTLDDSMLGGDIVVGTRYLSKYVPTMPIIKDGDGIAIVTAKLRLRSLLTSVSNTGFLAAKTTSRYGNSADTEFTGRTVGDLDVVLGTQTLSNDVFIVPFRNNAQHASIEYFTDSHLPATLLDIGWVGQYTKRGRRMSAGG